MTLPCRQGAKPVAHVPAVYTASALLIVAVALWIVLRSRLVSSPALGLAMVTAVAAAPYSGEIWGNLVNTHWFSALVILAACLPPRSNATGTTLHLALPLFALSGPSSLILCPVVATTSWHRTDRWRWLTLAIVGVGAALTLWAMTTAPRDHAGETLVARVVTVGHAGLLRYQLQVFAVAFVGLAITAWHAWKTRDLLRLTLAGTACLFAAAVCVSAPKEALYSVPAAAGRYILIPWIATSWLVIDAISTGRSWGRALVASVLATAAIWHYRQPPRPDVRWAQAAACLEQQHSCEIWVTPYTQPLRLPGRGH